MCCALLATTPDMVGMHLRTVKLCYLDGHVVGKGSAACEPDRPCLWFSVLVCAMQRPSQRSRRCSRMRMCGQTARLPRSARRPGRRSSRIPNVKARLAHSSS